MCFEEGGVCFVILKDLLHRDAKVLPEMLSVSIECGDPLISKFPEGSSLWSSSSSFHFTGSLCWTWCQLSNKYLLTQEQNFDVLPPTTETDWVLQNSLNCRWGLQRYWRTAHLVSFGRQLSQCLSSTILWKWASNETINILVSWWWAMACDYWQSKHTVMEQSKQNI